MVTPPAPAPERADGKHWWNPFDWPELIGWKRAMLAWRWRTPAPPTAYERRGLWFWGIVVGLILLLELAAATLSDFVGWPTISSTVGHLEDIDSRVGVLVVLLLTAAVFYALSWRTEHPPETHPTLSAPTTDGNTQLEPFVITDKKGRPLFGYTWTTVLLATALITGLVFIGELAGHDPVSKYHVGYAIYGSLGFFGIAVPLLLIKVAGKTADFPNLFSTLEFLRIRFRVLAFAVVAGLAILFIHLSLYPWPDLARENITYAGLESGSAREQAQAEIKRRGADSRLGFTSQVRGQNGNGKNVWLVYFNTHNYPASGDSGCVVLVRKLTKTDAILLKGTIDISASSSCRP
jgi:hypothetical protein